MKNLKFAFLIVGVIGLFAFTSTQMLKTSLTITVRNNLGNIEEGVNVQLFPTEEDYRNETNPSTDKLVSDKKGRVRFKDLEPKVYFVNAVKGDKNNIGAGVQTDTLAEGKVNKVTIIIE